MNHTLSVKYNDAVDRYHVMRDDTVIVGSFATEPEAHAHVARLATEAEARLEVQERFTGAGAKLTREEYTSLFARTKLHLRSSAMLALPNDERRAKVLEHKRWLETIKSRINVAIVSADDEVNELDAEVTDFERSRRAAEDRKYVPKTIVKQTEKDKAAADLAKLLGKLDLNMDLIK